MGKRLFATPRRWATAVLVAGMGVVGTAHAAVLFDQPLILNGGVFSNPGQIIADDFSLPMGGSINEVIWYGDAFAGLPISPMSVTFYADAGGRPGLPAVTSPVTPTIVHTGMTNVFFGGQTTREILQFTAAIPTFNAFPRASYFFSVEESQGTNFVGNFVWANSSASRVALGSFDGGNTWVNAPSAAAYTLVSTPVLPIGITSNGVFTFNTPVVGGIPIFIDPSVAVGYDYAIGAGDPFFDNVTLPTGIGDNLYTLSFDGQSFALAGGVTFDFTKYFAGGVDAFEVTGIETEAGLNPADPAAFPTEVTFAGSGRFTGTMTPITASVAPEPATLALLGVGLAGLGFSRRKQ